MTLPITIVLITRNEEHRLPLFFEKVQPFLDAGGEIVMIDSGSSDTTREIGEQHGVQVYAVGDMFRHKITAANVKKFYKFFKIPRTENMEAKVGDTIFHFSAARNYGAEKASNDFILVMDAGDLLHHLNPEELKTKLLPGMCGRSLHQLSGGNKHMVNRVYDRRLWKYHHRCHEYIGAINKDNKQGLHYVEIPEDILSFQYVRQVAKKRPYTIPLFLDLQENPHYFRCWYYMVREFFYMKKYKLVVDAFRLGLKTQTDGWKAEMASACVMIGQSLCKLNKVKEAKQALYESFDYDPNRREAWIELAYIAQAEGNHATAVALAKASLIIPFKASLYEPMGNYREVPHIVIYRNLYALNKNDPECKKHYNLAKEFNPVHPLIKEHAPYFQEQASILKRKPLISQDWPLVIDSLQCQFLHEKKVKS